MTKYNYIDPIGLGESYTTPVEFPSYLNGKHPIKLILEGEKLLSYPLPLSEERYRLIMLDSDVKITMKVKDRAMKMFLNFLFLNYTLIYREGNPGIVTIRERLLDMFEQFFEETKDIPTIRFNRESDIALAESLLVAYNVFYRYFNCGVVSRFIDFLKDSGKLSVIERPR